MNKENLLKLTFDEGRAPKSVTYCFLSQCPRQEDCAHHLCFLANGERMGEGRAVFPSMLKDGSCQYFAPLRVARMAWGFDGLFREVKVKDAARLRARMHELLGSKGQYYRYKLGQMKLLPEQQAAVKRLFADFGYENVEFDHFSDEIDFTKC